MSAGADEPLAPHSATSSAPRPAYYNERLSLPRSVRVTGGVGLACLAGASLGFSHGGTIAGMRFRAENAHRFPSSQAGWYLYHKSKNYNVVVGSVKEGLKMGLKVAVWTGGFLGIEEFVDENRGTKDFVSSAFAGLGVGAAFSLWNMFPLMTALRTTKAGLYGGIAFGLVQDVLGLARGRHLRYIDSVAESIGFSNYAQSGQET